METGSRRELKHLKSIVEEELKYRLMELSHAIHDHPEQAFEEVNAAQQVSAFMEEEGFQVTRNVGGMETAIKAVYDSGKNGPAVVFLAEYDALPEIGHACGHNVIAATSVGAAAVLSRLVKETGGRVILMGTPAEEIGGGKIRLIEAGAFNDIDFALMMHPADESMIGRGSTACSELVINFYGQSAHSSRPEKGIDALRPLIQMFNHVNGLLPAVSHRVRINGIITAGGTASNVIVDHACGKFLIRSPRRDEVETILSTLQHLAKGEAGKIGASVELYHDEIYAERYPNKVMEERFRVHMENQGVSMIHADPNEPAGSSDAGNVSMVLPTIHPYLAITGKQVNSHTREFAAASASPRADEMILKGAAALAMVGYELLVDSEFRESVRKEFEETVNDLH
ncbi:MAG: M20 family metallopeptidase [Bacillota bacterium]|nr:M20 family metallopeptidase [Bacillota bacterium]MDW7676410.1 M20 family metallopeptidase [Bacillota bacterium]